MNHPPSTTLLGIVVGSIMPQSNPLLIGIFAEPGGHLTTKVKTITEPDYPYYTAVHLAEEHKDTLIRLWQNGNSPNWYYLQFDEHCPPSKLYGWALPLVVYGSWDPLEDDIPGLVELSISEQPSES